MTRMTYLHYMRQRKPVLLIGTSFLLWLYICIDLPDLMVLPSIDKVNETVLKEQYMGQRLKNHLMVYLKPIPVQSQAEIIISQERIPFNMGLFTLIYYQVMPELRLLKREHEITYDPKNHKIVSDQVRTTLYALDCWEKIHTVTDQYGNARYINDVEAKRELNQHGKEASFNIEEYFEYSEYLNSLEKNVFHWAIKDMSILQLKHSFKDKKGLVTTMGNRQFYSGYTTLKVLRDHGCTLPFEIFYLGENDLTVEYRNKLSTLNDTTIIDLSQYIREDASGWACKPFVMLFSSFREVVFIDSDTFFLQPVERVFVQPLYIQHGALFFLDRALGTGRSNNVIQWMDQLIAGHSHISSLKIMRSTYMLGFSDHIQESGVVVIDKGRHFGALLSVCQLNLKEERTVTYMNVYGDKETYWLGFEMAGDSNWAFSPFAPGALGPISAEDQDSKKYRICSSKIIHLDYQANPLWFNGGILRNKFVSESEMKFEEFSYWSVGPGNWELFDSNIACFNSSMEPIKIENDSYTAKWLASHKKEFQKVAIDLPLIQSST